MKTFRLSNGVEIPAVGYGSYLSTEGNGKQTIIDALDAGYRYIDTAMFYQNEAEIGEALAEYDIKREDLFLVSKVWHTMLGREKTLQSFEASLKALGTDYIDMFLIHWPMGPDKDTDWLALQTETWKLMEELYEAGRVRAIGLSNFLPHHIEPLIKNIKIMPMLDQLELHVGYMQEYALNYLRSKGIVIQAWSPLGRARVLNDERVLAIAGKYGKSAAQILLRYLLDRDIAVIPKASSKERMKQNLDVFDFHLTDEEISFLSCIPETGWSGEHPDMM
ncbi:MAG: aldo/keto reductase [Lachnospiraceae bacterium]|nr:aldo/keto reductase [Lachnospiraceae bacterium]